MGTIMRLRLLVVTVLENCLLVIGKWATLEVSEII